MHLDALSVLNVFCVSIMRCAAARAPPRHMSTCAARRPLPNAQREMLLAIGLWAVVGRLVMPARCSPAHARGAVAGYSLWWLVKFHKSSQVFTAALFDCLPQKQKAVRKIFGRG